MLQNDKFFTTAPLPDPLILDPHRRAHRSASYDRHGELAAPQQLV